LIMCNYKASLIKHNQETQKRKMTTTR